VEQDEGDDRDPDQHDNRLQDPSDHVSDHA
jgi:hypothetical protein